MLSRSKLLRLSVGAVFTALPTLAQGQIILTDGDFLATNYTSSVAGSTPGFVTDIRYNIDYSSFLPFDPDPFLSVSIPPSPRGGGSTTGLFITGNNDSINFPGGSPTMATVTRNGLNVGTGTANPNYVMRVDVFNSTGNGVDNGSGTIGSNGQVTTYSYLGLNQSNPTVQITNLNAPGATGSQPGQGLGLLITADGGAADDFLPVYGGARYQDRALADTVGQAYSQTTQPTIHTGLLGMHLNDYWETQGFEFTETDVPADVLDNLTRTTGDGLFFAPDPTNVAGWTALNTGAQRSPYLDVFPKHNEPLHYSGGGVNPPAFLAPNTAHLTGGVPYNQWATHELYWVDGTFTYVVTYDGKTVPLLQFTPDADGLNGDDTVFSPFSSAGSAVLGFFDRFASIAVGPDGANFVVYDNLEIAVADAGDVPSVMDYLDANGYTISAGVPGDFDGDDDVDGRDFLAWQRGESPSALSAEDLQEWQTAYNGGLLSAVSSVPEPASVLLIVTMAGCGLVGRRRG